jgi:glucose-6-phosphate isomerase
MNSGWYTIYMKFDYNKPERKEAFEESLVSLREYEEHVKNVVEKRDYASPESSLVLPFDDELLSEVYRLRDEKQTGKIKYIFVVGIGGSNLGTKAIADALLGSGDFLDLRGAPRCIFVDTVNTRFLSGLEEFLDTKVESLDEILVTVISKSGTTTESLFNLEIISQKLLDRFGEDLYSRMVAITTENSPLWEKAQEKNIATLSIPENVGGRYSVFSAVGLFPLSFLPINLEKLRAGAQKMLNDLSEGTNHPAKTSAAFLAHYQKQGKTINDNFFFNGELESLGKWYRQLMGESVGKELNIDGDVVNTGITPTVSIGSTDLHSVAQLYLGGPEDKVTTFVYAPTNTEVINNGKLFPGLLPMIEGKSSEDVTGAILKGVKRAYTEDNQQFMEITLEDINEEEIGAFLQFKMLEMMFLGKLLSVNAFNQPSVESYKVATREILEE